MKPWPVYAVSIDGHGPELVCERSRSAASYRSFQNYREHYWRCTFEEWLRMARLTKVPAIPESEDGYRYVREAYGVVLALGDQVTFRGEPSLVGQSGVVIYPGRSTATVRVVLSSGRATNVHPSNIVRAA